MSGFLYYLPGKDRDIKLPEIGAAGLGYAFESSPTPCRVERGPGGGGSGVVLADGDAVSKVGFYPEEQTWRRVPDTTAWVGYFNDDKPGPEDLQRAQVLDGYFVMLGDGNRWIVPVAREPADGDTEITWSSRLPKLLELDDDGQYTAGDVLPKFRGLVDAATAWFEAVEATEDGGEVGMSFPMQVVTALDILKSNYRIGPAEAVALGLFTYDGPEVLRILNVATDLGGYLEIKKKQASATSATDAG